jgi:hypothetical protein
VKVSRAAATAGFGRTAISSTGRKATSWTGIEVFTVEETYGNTVFADELMTGRWG